MKRKFGALLMAFCMVFTMLPGIPAAAANAEGEEHVHTYDEFHEWLPSGDGVSHFKICEECGEKTVEEHNWHTYTSDGKIIAKRCNVCDGYDYLLCNENGLIDDYRVVVLPSDVEYSVENEDKYKTICFDMYMSAADIILGKDAEFDVYLIHVYEDESGKIYNDFVPADEYYIDDVYQIETAYPFDWTAEENENSTKLIISGFEEGMILAGDLYWKDSGETIHKYPSEEAYYGMWDERFYFLVLNVVEEEHTHTYGDWIANTDGTTHTRTCTAGDDSETENHNWVEYEKDNRQWGENYSNGEYAYEFYKCRDCGFEKAVYYEMYVEDSVLDTLEKEDSYTYLLPVNTELLFKVQVARYTETEYGTTEEIVPVSEYTLGFPYEPDLYGTTIEYAPDDTETYEVVISTPVAAGYPYSIRFAIQLNENETYDYTATKSGVDAFAYNLNLISVEAEQKNAGVSYQTHVQNVGWQKYVSNGETSGTSGQSLRLEGIRINLEDADYDGGIEYATHVQNIGWQKYVSDGEMAGTSGQSLRLEAIKIRLTGEMEEHYDVYYRVHAQNVGWMGWAKNGEEAGTSGYSYRLEAIQIVLVPKGEAAPGSTSNAYLKKQISYSTHVQNVGWQSDVSDGATSGTSGQSLRLEGIKINLENPEYSGSIEYTTHVQNIGWQNYVSNGAMSGTSGQSLRLEAIRIRLTGEMAEHYDVYYRVHAQNYGWMGWAKNGESAGTSGQSLRLEAIQIVLVPKGESAPGSTANAFVAK